MTKSKKMIIGTLPFVALIVLFAIFCGIVSSKGYIVWICTLKSYLTRALYYQL